MAISYAKMNRVRAAKCGKMGVPAIDWPPTSARAARICPITPPGDNCFILEDNTVQPFVTIGNNVTLWSGNHIGHDSVIEDHCFLTSHVVVSGNVRVRPYCFIGVNATLRNSIKIAPATLVGAGPSS